MQKTVTLRVPDSLLRESSSVFELMGLDLPTAMRMYLVQVAATRSIPFEVKAPDTRWEIVPVDEKTQGKMDDLADLWRKRKQG